MLDLKGYSLEYLRQFQEEINQEIRDRQSAEQRKAWDAIDEAITSYCSRYGAINIWLSEDGDEVIQIDGRSIGVEMGQIIPIIG